MAYDSPHMISRYQRKSIQELEMYVPKMGMTPLVFQHGVKSADARNIVRSKLGV
jgi:hypothetical protein